MSTPTLREAAAELLALKDMKDRLRKLHEMGHGTDYGDYHRRKPLAWDALRAALAADRVAGDGKGIAPAAVAQAEPVAAVGEPVAWRIRIDDHDEWIPVTQPVKSEIFQCEPLYAAPPQPLPAQGAPDQPLFAWVLAHPETAAEVLQECAADGLDPLAELTKRRDRLAQHAAARGEGS